MKTLKELITLISPLEIKGNTDVLVPAISINSSSIKEGSLFVAIKGEKLDGHAFINEAIEKGAKVIIHENDIEGPKDEIVYVKVADTHEACGIIASNFYDNPSKNLKLVGVTGTNGKTTVATLLHKLFRNLGKNAGMIGTVVNKINDEEIESERTTPDPITLNELLKKMVDAGCEYSIMEVSSHAISLKRISGLKFSGGIFTNLTHDHLDFHKTMDEYAKVKQEFFTGLQEESFAISNLDSDYGEFMLEHTKAKKYFYSRDKQADFNGKVETKLIGDFNQSNLLAILGTAILLGVDENVARDEIKKLDPAPGRFVSIKSVNGVTGIVDYAHTPDGLKNVLETVQDIKENGKVIAVFGCGGDRDKAKRPVMAKIGYDLSDMLILTSDNPRTENGDDILKDMLAGIPDYDATKVIVLSDRHQAIKKACELAQSGDCILLAGKGHENYQEVNGTKTHFDDMEELKKYLL
jgi:UDP-N-acetylmuramoyl-L-alanyl-D-glutamate--2,6-diaminopimelate ligase